LNNLLDRIYIRPIKQSDLPGLEWDGEYIHFRRLYAEVYQRVEQGDGAMWVVELEVSKIIGQLFISYSNGRSVLSNGNNRAYIYGFRIRPEYRNQGIGSTLMQVVEADLIQKGFHKITLNVAQDNPDALRLYKRLGYKVVAYEAGEWSYVDHTGVRIYVKEPAWKMEKELIRGR
jgi:ribosomal protein S18 acetylase RimI-like enzyme